MKPRGISSETRQSGSDPFGLLDGVVSNPLASIGLDLIQNSPVARDSIDSTVKSAAKSISGLSFDAPAPKAKALSTEQKFGLETLGTALNLAGGLESLNEAASDKMANIQADADLQAKISEQTFEQNMEIQQADFEQRMEFEEASYEQSMAQLEAQFGLSREVMSRNTNLEKTVRQIAELDVVLGSARAIDRQEVGANQQQFFRNPATGASI